jgi:RHS repeat-associated protein
VDALGNRTTSVFDAAGNLTGVQDANSHLLQFLYDANNRLTVTVDGAGDRTTSLRDAAGNVTQVTDPLTHNTQFLYDALNRQTVTIDANNYRTTTMLDAVGNVTGIQDPSANHNLTTFAYDALNRKISYTDPAGHTGTFAYTAVDRIASTTDRDGRVINFSYDADNRLTTETWLVSGSTVNTLTFLYDGVGNLTSAASNTGTYTMSYDALNRTTVVNEPFNLTLTFSYDAVGNRTLVQDSQGGMMTSVYDGANELTSRQFSGNGATFSFGLTYTGTHQLSTIMRYNNVMGTGNIASSTFLYDAADRVTSIQHQNAGGTSLASFLYSYDTGGRLTTTTDNGTLKTYTYDVTNQLTGDGTNTFTFDGAGNRTNTGYSTGTGNQLLADGANTYTYDSEGNLSGKTRTSDGENWVYSYDNKNELTQVVEKTSTALVVSTAAYKYDVFGNRIEKDVTTGSTVTTRFGYDGWKVHLDAAGNPQIYVGNENWDVWVDMDGSNNLQTRYVRGDVVDQLFARLDSSGNTYWILTDRQGSVRTVLNSNANVKDQISYDGWGNASQTQSSYGGRYLYTGREFDPETGLQYNRARYYDATSGRWTTQDPLGFAAGDANVYRYVANSPTTLTDPTGLIRIRPRPRPQPDPAPPAPGGGMPGGGGIPQGPMGLLPGMFLPPVQGMPVPPNPRPIGWPARWPWPVFPGWRPPGWPINWPLRGPLGPQLFNRRRHSGVQVASHDAGLEHRPQLHKRRMLGDQRKTSRLREVKARMMRGPSALRRYSTAAAAGRRVSRSS